MLSARGETGWLALRHHEFGHKTVAMGGTFDIIHKGHVALLSRAFELGETVFIGVTGDALVVRLHKSHPVRPFSARVRDLRAFLKSHGWLRRARIVELKDPYGPALHGESVEALVVSQDTRSNGRKVNSLRRAQGYLPLRLYVVELVKAEDGGLISASRIRRGEVDADGRLRRGRPASHKKTHGC